MLLLVAVNDRRYRFEVGRGLEPVIPDIIAGRIGRTYLQPNFMMKDSMKRVDATREFRMTQELPLLDPVQKVDLLESYHPDFIEDVFRELKVGPSKGSLTPKPGTRAR